MTIGTATDTRSVVLAWTEAINRHDIDALSAFHSHDCTFANHGTGRRAEGSEAVRAAHESLLARISDLRIDVTQLIVQDGHFAKVWTMTGSSAGVPGMPPAGQPIRFSGVGIGEVRDGLIVSQVEYFNPADTLD